MAEKRKRGQNFSIEEKDKLIKLLCQHKDTILNKKTDGTTNDAKIKAWVSLTNSFNSSGNNYRSKDSLIKLWEKMKSEGKIYFNFQKRNFNGTGGGPSTHKIDPILEQVCNILGRGCTGITGVNDCDSELPSTIESDNQPQKVTYVGESDVNKVILLEEKNEVTILPMLNETEIETNENNMQSTPLWSKRRRPLHNNSEKSEAVNTLCNSFKQVNKKKEDIEELKKQLLMEEIEFKRKLYDLQLQAASKEVEIKNEILLQIKGMFKLFDNF